MGRLTQSSGHRAIVSQSRCILNVSSLHSYCILSVCLRYYCTRAILWARSGHTTGKCFLNVRSPARKWSIFGVWPAPGARETLLKGGVLRPPPFKSVSRGPGAGQTPKIDHFLAGVRTYKKHFPVVWPEHAQRIAWCRPQSNSPDVTCQAWS